MKTPILYSFRRCPYAIRARLAIASSGVQVELREVRLRDKAPEFLETSPSATVPCLKSGDLVIDESFDIMLWALGQNDPEHLLNMPPEGKVLIDTTDGPFKTALDRYKYHTRYENCDRGTERQKVSTHMSDLNARLAAQNWLFGESPSLADFAILPFVRQFAFTDKKWFDEQDWPNVQRWLESFIASQRFMSVMTKYPKWDIGDSPTSFP